MSDDLTRAIAEATEGEDLSGVRVPAEIERLRATNARLNRRAQTAEAALHELTTTTGRGKSRAVAAEVWERCVGTHEAACSRAREAEAEIDRLRAALDAERAKAEVPTEPAADLGVGEAALRAVVREEDVDEG